MEIESIFTIPAEGVGRRDYAWAIESSVATTSPTALRQMVTSVRAVFTLATTAFPTGRAAYLPLPQIDGTWGYVASSIPVHFFSLTTSTDENVLVAAGFYKYDSTGLSILLRHGIQFGYGTVTCEFPAGVNTDEGYYYCQFFGVWTDKPTYTARIIATAVASQLTLPWL